MVVYLDHCKSERGMCKRRAGDPFWSSCVALLDVSSNASRLLCTRPPVLGNMLLKSRQSWSKESCQWPSRWCRKCSSIRHWSAMVGKILQWSLTKKDKLVSKCGPKIETVFGPQNCSPHLNKTTIRDPQAVPKIGPDIHSLQAFCCKSSGLIWSVGRKRPLRTAQRARHRATHLFTVRLWGRPLGILQAVQDSKRLNTSAAHGATPLARFCAWTQRQTSCSPRKTRANFRALAQAMLASSCMQRRSSKSISKNSCRTKVLLGKFTSAGGNVDKCLAASSAVARSQEESMYTASTLLTAVTDNPPCSKRSLLRRAACSQLRKRNLFSCKEAFNASQRSAAAMACLWPPPATAFSKFPCVYIPSPHLRRHESTIKYKLTSYRSCLCFPAHSWHSLSWTWQKPLR